MAKRMYRRVTRSELQFKRLQAADQKRIFAALLWLANQKGFKPGWAAWKFKAIYDCWPQFSHREIEPQEPPSDLLTWLERERRRYGTAWKRKRMKEEADAKSASAIALSRIEAILGEIEANPLIREPCCQEDTDGEALDLVSEIVLRRDRRISSSAGLAQHPPSGRPFFQGR